jgi:hypothetical protein
MEKLHKQLSHRLPRRQAPAEWRKEMKFQQLKTDYRIPDMLQKDIDALEEGIKNHVSYIDCLQDEIRGSAHGCTGGDYDNGGGLTEEQAEEIITYYCRRRWN